MANLIIILVGRRSAVDAVVAGVEEAVVFVDHGVCFNTWMITQGLWTIKLVLRLGLGVYLMLTCHIVPKPPPTTTTLTTTEAKQQQQLVNARFWSLSIKLHFYAIYNNSNKVPISRIRPFFLRRKKEERSKIVCIFVQLKLWMKEK